MSAVFLERTKKEAGAGEAQLNLPSPTINLTCEPKDKHKFSPGCYLITAEKKPDKLLQKHASPRGIGCFSPKPFKGSPGPRFLLEF